MGKFWLGIGILAIFLVLGFGVSAAMDMTHNAIAATLDTAAESALSGDLKTGQQQALSAKQAWEKSWHSSATVADHGPMDEIDGLFAQLSVYSRAGNTGDFAACCTRISMLVQAMSEAHSLTWWNLL